MNNSAEMTDGDEDDRNGKQNPKREDSGQAGHDHDGDDHGDEGLAGVHDSGAEDHADIVEVVGGAGHELAGAIPDIKLRFHEKQLIEEGTAEVEFDVAGNTDENPACTEGEKPPQQNEQKQKETVDT